jgi:hypothetical protein
MDFGDRPPADFGVARALYGRDPEGNLIEIQEIEQDGMRLDELTPLAR